MKTLQLFGKLSTILILSALLVPSCTKQDTLNSNVRSTSNDFAVAEFQNTTGTPQAVSYCSIKTVPLCVEGSTVGNVEVKRGTDDKIYITYSGNSGWYLAQVNLFAGLSSAIPASLSNFSNKKTFTYPFSDQSYGFVLSGLPGSFTIVAYAMLVKKSSNGLITSMKVAWGDGCNGKPLVASSSKNDGDDCGDDKGDKDKDDKGKDDKGKNDDKDKGKDDDKDKGKHDDDNNADDHGKAYQSECPTCVAKEFDGGTYFTYTSAACTVPPVSVPAAQTVVEPDICSEDITTFFGIQPDYGIELPWPVPTVTMAGYTYTEAEARAIAKAADAYGLPQDSKYAFQRAATLLLSNTDYPASPSVGAAMKAVLDWLSTKGKLSPTNLPTGNAAVKAHATFLDSWITNHLCTGRR